MLFSKWLSADLANFYSPDPTEEEWKAILDEDSELLPYMVMDDFGDLIAIDDGIVSKFITEETADAAIELFLGGRLGNSPINPFTWRLGRQLFDFNDGKEFLIADEYYNVIKVKTSKTDNSCEFELFKPSPWKPLTVSMDLITLMPLGIYFVYS